MPPKSIYRRPGAKHFQLVHRSQRDPLANDPDASPHVLKPFERDNVARKGRSLAELEAELADESQGASKVRDNLGEAVLYGVDFDDSEYDYMQHLREFGVSEDGVESILIEAPAASQPKKKAAAKQPIQLKDEGLIPREALASTYEVERDYERDADAGEAIPSALRGLQPDMNPHLRQTLEALDDDAFIADDIDEDDFFAELVGDGEADEDEEPDFPFVDEGLNSDQPTETGEDDEQDESFEARFKRFKQAQKAAASQGSDDGSDIETERADTISGLPKLPVVGGKRRRKGASDASGYSLSSSSMFRNQGLTDLDDRYDEIERQYEDDEDEDDDSNIDSDGDEAPDLVAAREDFNSLVDDFLENYEQVGNKLKHVMPGEAPLDKLDALRRAFDAPVTPSSQQQQPQRRKSRPVVDPAEIVEEDEKDRWDCETILSTYTNIENHPRLIRARAEKPVPKIKLDPKTGLPSVVEPVSKFAQKDGDAESDSGSDSGIDMRQTRETVTRPRDETPEEKKARKQAVKEERQARRVEKKATKVAFANESRKQVKNLTAQDAGKTRKL
ncbi:Low temperature viability protein [Auricularia subglabra TFB-10046 SS5]|nr:Low temperature viability protein [Auricularia subglabra TFB-10046 SS5]